MNMIYIIRRTLSSGVVLYACKPINNSGMLEWTNDWATALVWNNLYISRDHMHALADAEDAALKFSHVEVRQLADVETE